MPGSLGEHDPQNHNVSIEAPIALSKAYSSSYKQVFETRPGTGSMDETAAAGGTMPFAIWPQLSLVFRNQKGVRLVWNRGTSL
jgi:hypothetical protein